MRAVASYEGRPIVDPEALVDVHLPVPELRPRDVLVAVEAVSVNPADIKRRASLERSDPPVILGYDAAGPVTGLGAGATTRPGATAELQAVDERIVARRPRSLTAADAAALPLTSITAWEALFDRLA